MVTPTLLGLPPEVIDLIGTFADNSVAQLNKTCKSLQPGLQTPYKNYQKRRFVELFGSITPSERDIPIDILVEKTNEITTFAKGIPQSDDLWFEMDLEKGLQCVNYRDRFFNRTTSFFELLKAKYRYGRGEFHQERDRQLQSLINDQNKIALECDQPFDPSHPLQDLRDRSLRLLTLEKERASLHSLLKNCDADFFARLTLWEKIVFYVISFFHSFIHKPYIEDLEIPPLKTTFKTVNKRQVLLGNTQFDSGGILYPVEIKAHLGSQDGSTFANQTTFTFCPPGLPFSYAHFKIERIWKESRKENSSEIREDYSENSTRELKGSLSSRKLFITIACDTNINPLTGDRPLLRIMIQLAVEVFQLESDPSLQIASRYRDAPIYVSGGFCFSFFDDEKTQSLRDQINEARQANRLFPQPQNVTPHWFNLEKSASNPTTQFVTLDKNDQEHPALVDFTLNQSPMPWEDKIRNHRLLPFIQGPILPKFFTRNLFLHEKRCPITGRL